MTNNPVISVAVITYNHGPFVDHAIESILAQDTNTPYEIVIGDDASVDHTAAKLQGWHERYPDRIRLVLRQQNVGMMENFLGVIEACRGKYIAFLEGDDYWIDTGKLTQQLGFLEKYSHFSAVFGEVELYDQESQKVLGLKSGQSQQRQYSLCDVLIRNPANLMTAFFRNPAWSSRPAVFKQAPFGDWPLFVHLAETGDIAYYPKTWARYRIHDGGVWQGGKAGNMRQREVQMLHYFQELFPRFNNKTNKRIRHLQLAICEDYRKLRDYRTAINTLKTALREAGRKQYIRWVPGITRLFGRFILDKRFYTILYKKVRGF